MDTYQMITLEEALCLSSLQFRNKYNDAVETIWHLQQELHELRSENEALWKSYEEVSDQLFG